MRVRDMERILGICLRGFKERATERTFEKNVYPGCSNKYG